MRASSVMSRRSGKPGCGRDEMIARNASNPDVEAIVGKLSSSENLQYSPVSFLIRAISELIEGKKPPEAFARETIIETKKAQFYFKHMPHELQVQNLDVFDREFTLADEINEYVAAYMKMDDEDRCSAESFNGAILAFAKKYMSQFATGRENIK